MSMTFALTLGLEGSLADIPLGGDGAITRLDGGGYALAAEAAGLGFSILRIFDAEGQAVRSFGLAGTSPALAVSRDGALGIATITDTGTVSLSRYSGDFQSVTSSEISSPVGMYRGVSLAASVTGGFVAATLVENGSHLDLTLNYISPAGTLVLVAIAEMTDIVSSDPDVVLLENNHILVSRAETDPLTGKVDVVLSTFDSAGLTVIDRLVLPDSAGSGSENRHARVAATQDGFAVVYETRLFSFAQLDIRLRTFDFAGNQTGDVLVTNRNFGNTGTDDGFDDVSPEIAVGPDGRIAVTWTRIDGAQQDQLLWVIGQESEETVGFGNAENRQEQPLVCFFGTGNIAAYHRDETLGALVGEQFSGFRDAFGDSGNDSYTGDDFRDLINGLGGNDTLFGENNNDTLLGADGNDVLFGGSGDDSLEGDEQFVEDESATFNDYLYGDDGQDTLSGGLGGDQLFGGNGADMIGAGEGNDSVFGGVGDDILAGGSGADSMLGESGDDFLQGESENDTLAGGAGNDTLNGGVGNDTIYLGIGTDSAEGGIGNDLIFGGAGTNAILGGSGNDTVFGGTGFDRIFGGDGVNRLLGNEGNDSLQAGGFGDFLAGGSGNDTILGGLGNDDIFCGLGDDFVGAGEGNDRITAGAGSNRISGGLGNDTIIAGTGRDVVTGSLGEDVFVFGSAASIGLGAGRDVITDFARSVDRIDLSAMNLTFVGGATFTGATGQLRSIGGFLVGDTNGDRLADFAIELTGGATLGLSDLIL
jgi:Ca2+-binding RTX toxin-like protein